MHSSPSVMETYSKQRAFVKRQEREFQSKTGMRMIDFAVLDEIRRNPGQQLGSVGLLVGLTPAEISTVVNRLFSMSWIRRIPHEDRRVMALELTDAGRITLEQVVGV